MLRLSSLTVLGGPLHGKGLRVEEGAEVLIGSDPDCHFHLDAPGVSPIHARILLGPEGATLHDTRSPHGLYLNTERVESQALLGDGDTFTLGPALDRGSVVIRCEFEETEEPALSLGEGDLAVPGEEHTEPDDLVALTAVEETEDEKPPEPVAPGPPAPPVPPEIHAAPTPADEALGSELAFEPVEDEPARLAPVEPPAAVRAPEVAPAAETIEDFFVEEPAPESAPPPEALPPAEAPPPRAPTPAPTPAFEGFPEERSAAAFEASGAAAEAQGDRSFFVDASSAAEAETVGPPAAGEDTAFFIEDSSPAAEPAGPSPSPPPSAPPLEAPVTADETFFVEAQEVVEAEVFEVSEGVEAREVEVTPAEPVAPAPMAPVSAPPAPSAPVARPPSPAPALQAEPRPPAGGPPAAGPEEQNEPPPLPPRRTDTSLPRIEPPGAARRPSAARPPAGARPPARARARGGTPVARLVGLAGLGLLVVAGGGFLALRLLGGPRLEGIEPRRARVGETVVVTGTGFAPEPGANEVLFGDKAGTVLKASDTRLEVAVPEGAAVVGEDARLPLRVRVKGRDSPAEEITIFQGPTIHGISPDVAMPGDEIVLLGMGWGVGASVRFGSTPAQVLVATDTSIRVRVPRIEGRPGTSAPVVVSMGATDSNPGPFLVGQVPLVLKVEPVSASPGDLITIAGRGFRRDRKENTVEIGGASALVVSAFDTELKAVVPRVGPGGSARPLELRVAGSDNVGRSTLSVAPPPEGIEFHFVAEPFDLAPGRDHAVLWTDLGPAFVLSSAGGRSAAERAVDAQRRLNDAAVLLKASRTQEVELRDAETRPALALVGRPDVLLEVTDEDAAAYAEDWTGLRGRGGAVTRYRLARWWEAIARDLLLLLVRGEKPRYAAGLAPEGRVLEDVYEAARKTGYFGVPHQVVAEARPPTREALRTLGYRVPASVKALAGAGAGPAAAAAAAGPPPLKLEGTWTGSENEGGLRRWLTIRFRPSGGNISYEGTVTLTVPILTIEPQPKSAVRFSVQFRGGLRYYLGQWDGEVLSGKISSDPAGAQPMGTFELRPR